MKITSLNNELIKETAKLHQRKYRDEQRLFLLEGRKCVEEAISSGLKIERVFVLDGEKEFSGTENILTNEAVLRKISTTETPPKVVAVANQVNYKWNNNYNKIILLEGIKDAGNLGTIIRTSAAFGVDAVILYGDTVDLYNPKCVRSSVGNLWKIPVFSMKSKDELIKISKNYSIIGTLPNSDNTVMLNDFKKKSKILIMFGSEASGLSAELKNIADENITIEMSDNVESLNLSISVGVVLYSLMTMSY